MRTERKSWNEEGRSWFPCGGLDLGKEEIGEVKNEKKERSERRPFGEQGKKKQGDLE